MKLLIGSLWKLKVNDLFELLMELVKIGLTPEEISERLELDFETIIMSSKKCQQ